MKLPELRGILQYVTRFRDKIFVVAIDGEILGSENFANILLDVAVLRIKVQGVLQQAPDNRRVLYDASRLIARKYGAQLHFDRSDCASLKSVVNAGLQLAAGTLPDPLKLTGKLL